MIIIDSTADTTIDQDGGSAAPEIPAVLAGIVTDSELREAVAKAAREVGRALAGAWQRNRGTEAVVAFCVRAVNTHREQRLAQRA